MNPFQLAFPISKFPFEIRHGEKLLFLGSCFSDEIAKKAKFHGFKVRSNPFGTVFHPLALSRFLKESISEGQVNERIVSRQDIYLSWDANSSLHAMSENQLKVDLSAIRKEWRETLKDSQYLFVTFGTAWGYKNAQTNELVANCHKFSSTEFNKELSQQAEIVKEWNDILDNLNVFNPDLKIIFTVSPVRHSKDGLIENNQSKAILIDSVRQLTKRANCFYFPSYEIVIDELRDYRFFKTDRVHPNAEAIDYVWKRFSAVFFSEATMGINREVEKLRLAESHKSLFPESEEHQKYITSLSEIRSKFLNKYPTVNLD